MEVQFISSVSVIAPNPAESRKLYMSTLGLPLEQMGGSEYYASEHVEGSKHFGVWPLSEAAEACFGSTGWPSGTRVPQVSVEFELESPEAVAAGAAELEAAGYALLHRARTEPWGQTVARTLSPEGAIIGLSYAPWMHEA